MYVCVYTLYVCIHTVVCIYAYICCMCVCVCACIYIFIYSLLSIIFFIHSSMKGHLGGFHVLAFVSNAAVSTGRRSLFKIVISFPSDLYPEVGLLNHSIVLLLDF